MTTSTFISDNCCFSTRLPNNLKNIFLFLYEVGREVDSLSISKGTKKIFLVPSIIGKQNVNKEITISCVRQFTRDDVCYFKLCMIMKVISVKIHTFLSFVLSVFLSLSCYLFYEILNMIDVILQKQSDNRNQIPFLIHCNT